MNEVWKDIKGYDGIYQISNDRRIRSLDRVSTDGKKLKGKIKVRNGDPYGFDVVKLIDSNGKATNHKVEDLYNTNFSEDDIDSEHFVHLNFHSNLIDDVIKYASFTFDIVTDIEDDKAIGHGAFSLFSTQNASPFSIRQQCDALDEHMFDTMNSVRIFSDFIEKEEYEMREEHDHDDLDELKDVFNHFFGEDELGEDELVEDDCHENTENVFGILALLSDIKIKKEYRNQGIGKQAMKILEEYCETLNVNYILLKPFPTETESLLLKNDKFDKKKLQQSIERLLNFYEPLGFKRTIGLSDGIYLVKPLNDEY